MPYELRLSVNLEITAQAPDDETCSVMLRRIVKGIDWKMYREQFEKALEEQPENLQVTVRKV